MAQGYIALNILIASHYYRSFYSATALIHSFQIDQLSSEDGAVAPPSSVYPLLYTKLGTGEKPK